MNEQKQPIRIKGVGNRLWLTVDPQSPAEIIESELHTLFDPMRSFVRGGRVVLDLGEGHCNGALFDRITQYLKTSFKLDDIKAPPAGNDRQQDYFSKKEVRPNVIPKNSDNTMVMAGRVRSGQTVKARKHLIIMGDVNPGSEITAGGDIVVLGSLCGTAVAGYPSNAAAIIMALDFRPIQIKIGPIVAAGLPPSDSKLPEFAHVEAGVIIVEDYCAANPFKKLTWPIVR